MIDYDEALLGTPAPEWLETADLGFAEDEPEPETLSDFRSWLEDPE